MSMINNFLSNTLERMPVTFSTISNSTISPTVSTITPLTKLAQMNNQQLLVAINIAIPAEISTEEIIREYDIQTNEIYTEHNEKKQQIVTAWRLLTYLLGSDIRFPAPAETAELNSASTAQENKLLTLYHSDPTKVLIAKVLGCSPNAVIMLSLDAWSGSTPTPLPALKPKPSWKNICMGYNRFGIRQSNWAAVIILNWGGY